MHVGRLAAPLGGAARTAERTRGSAALTGPATAATTGGSTATEWVPTGSVTVRVPGKVNLYLTVGELRDDGYHDLTTVFHAVSLFDQVTVRNADLMSVEVVGIGADKVPTDRRNLAWQAAELLASHVGRVPDVAITIEKSIPVAGGMAGGSADAAGVLVAMNSLWELGLPRADLHMLAARLGSDVPFALHGGTALGTGRGEELTTVLRNLLDSPERRYQLGIAGRERAVDVYSWESVAAQTVNVYHRAIDRSHAC